LRQKKYEIYLDIKLNISELSDGNIKNTCLDKGIHAYTVMELIDKAIKNMKKDLPKKRSKTAALTRLV